MIHLPYKYQDQRIFPASLIRHTALSKLSEVMLSRNGNLFKRNHYGTSEVLQRLRAYSIGIIDRNLEANEPAKCFYCESYIEFATSLQVEHFRPKAKVDNLDVPFAEQPHSGYFWLGIEWTNLLLSCPKCNGKSAKGNRFPVANPRVPEHNPITVSQANPNDFSLERIQCMGDRAPLLTESPILINPEIEDPSDLFTFISDGSIHPKADHQQRAETNISIYDLNRDLLVRERDKKWQQIAKQIKIIYVSLERGRLNIQGAVDMIDPIISDIIKFKDISQNYTLWGRYINENLAELLDEINIHQRMKDYIIHRHRMKDI